MYRNFSLRPAGTHKRRPSIANGEACTSEAQGMRRNTKENCYWFFLGIRKSAGFPVELRKTKCIETSRCGPKGRIRDRQVMEKAKHAPAKRRACEETPKKTATGFFCSPSNQLFSQWKLGNENIPYFSLRPEGTHKRQTSNGKGEACASEAQGMRRNTKENCYRIFLLAIQSTIFPVEIGERKYSILLVAARRDA